MNGYNCEIFNSNVQKIQLNNNIIFENYDILSFIIIKDNMHIQVLSKGIYIINISLYLIETGEIKLYINDKLYNETFKSYSIKSTVFFHKMIILNEFDILSIKNCSPYDIMTKDANMCPNYKNFNMVIWKLDNTTLTTITE